MRRRTSEAAYRLLLRCYPGEFRDEYEREMLAAFRERFSDERRAGWTAVARLWMQVVADSIFRAPAEHLDVLSQDVRYAFRSLRRAPLFAAMALLTLALGIGANTAIFSVVNAVALRPLPYADVDRIVRLWEKNDELGIPQFSVSLPNYISWREQSRAFDAFGAWRGGSVTLRTSGDPMRVASASVSPSLLPLFGVKPLAGRLFLDGEDRPGSAPVAVIAEELWRRDFGASHAAVGSVVVVADRQLTIVGVVPNGAVPGPAEFFVPLVVDLANESRGNHTTFVVARLAPGVTPAQAQSEMDAIANRLSQQYPQSNKGWGVRSATLYDWLVPQQVRRGLYLVLGAVACVLLIACSNVANLMLARAAIRRREMAVRIAIGAARRRLIRQVLTEGIVLAAIGGTAGVLIALWGMPILRRTLPTTLPRGDEAAIDATVLAFSIAVSLLTGIVFGLLPALSASRRDVVDALKDGARGTRAGLHLSGNGLAIAQVAMATILVVTAGLLVQSLTRLQRVELGFNPENLTTAMMGLPGSRYEQHAPSWQLYRRLMERLAAMPGVRSVALSSGAPFGGGNTAMPVTSDGPSRLGTASLQVDWRMVSPGYFGTLGIPLLKGRTFQETDRQGEPLVLVVSAEMARRIWGDDEPVGRRIIAGQGQLCTVVGVVGDARNLDLQLDPNPTMYVSATQALWPTMTLIVRGWNDASTAAPVMRQALKELDPQLALFNVRTMEMLLDQSASQPRVTAWLVGLFALVALVLAGIGIYGVLAYLVSQRTREIGLRMALGAQPSAVLRLVVSRGMFLAGAGLVVGIVASAFVARAIQSLLFGVSALDPPTFGLAAAVLGVLAVLASYAPARRATRVDPLIALRSE